MNAGIVALLSRATNGENFNDAEQEAIRAALLQWLAGGSLDAAFHLDSGERGQRSAQSRLFAVLRNGRIRDAALQLALPSKRAAAREIARKWGRLADGKAPADPVDNFLAPAVRLYGRVSEGTIRRALD